MSAVVDTSVLIVLARLKLLRLLPALFTDIIVPERVLQEWSAGDDLPIADLAAAEGLPDNWLEVMAPEGTSEQDRRGEQDVMALAHETGADHALIDDLQARRRAQASGLKVIGTIGILTAAREIGAIGSVVDLLPQLREIEFFLDDAIVDQVMREES